MNRYFDTSALMPYYRPEPASAACEALLLDSPDGVCISHLTEVEMASVLARLVRTGELAEKDAERVQQAFAEDLDRRRIARESLAPEHFERALAWLLIRSTALRTLDALHLACASKLGAELVTCDRVLGEAARKFGVPCLFIEP